MYRLAIVHYAMPLFTEANMSNEDDGIVQLLQEVHEEVTKAPPITEIQAEDITEATISHDGQEVDVLQRRYDQIISNVNYSKDTLERMSKLVAFTFLPGKDRKVCPPVVSLRDSRLLVMDSFPDGPMTQPTHIGLTVFGISLTRYGKTYYGGPLNCEMFKTFNLRPYVGAGGLRLNAKNKTIFRNALAMRYALNQVLNEQEVPVTTFDQPTTLLGFPVHYTPVPEWRGPMMTAVLKHLKESAPILKCFNSTGGLILAIEEGRDGFKTIRVEKNGALIQFKYPVWCTSYDHVRPGAILNENVPMADLPRRTFNNIKEMTSIYSFRSLDWLERRILEEFTEILTLEESLFDQELGNYKVVETTWKCVPSAFVQTQTARSARTLLDLRKHLGRKTLNMEGFEDNEERLVETKVKVGVLAFPKRPLFSDCQFTDNESADRSTWFADLLSLRNDTDWTSRHPYRGVEIPF